MTGRHRTPDGGSPRGTDPSEVDSVPGDPPVPITVWRTAEDPGEHASPVPSRLAVRLVAAYCAAGEVIVDLTTAATIAAAARDTGRHHRRATFTPTIPPAVALGPVTAAANPPDPTGPAQDPPPERPSGRHRPAAATPGTGHDSSGRTGLVVACWPLHPDPAENTARQQALLAVTAGLLRPGGCLVLIANPTPDPPDTGPAVATAAAAGLGYLQHIVAVRATADGDTFTYYADPADLATLTGPARHRRAHTDLIVFLHHGPAADA
jgi:hypothetical protein